MKPPAVRAPGAMPRILHLHSTFAAGGKELRCVRLINAFGPKVAHSIVSAEPERMDAAAGIARGIKVDYPRDFPPLKGRPTPGRLQKLARAMQGYDLVLTYNWGAMDAAMAHTLFGEAMRLPPLIHHEDGFNQDELTRLKPTRNWYRKIALGRSAGLVVPSERLEEIALTAWDQPLGRVKRIANGIDLAAYRHRPKPDAMRGIIKHQGERWVGTLAGLRPIKNLARLVRAFAALPEDWQLVIIGEGPERERIIGEAARLNIGHRVHLPGHAADPAKVIGLFDIFALSSDSEQQPVALIEAMAAGCAVAATAVGDVAEMVAEENWPFVVPAGDERALAAALGALTADEGLRERLGQANRAAAEVEFSEQRMIDTYRRLYASAMGRPGLP